VLAILPAESRRKAEQSRLFAPDFGAQGYAKDHFDIIHQAVSAQQVLALRYRMKRESVAARRAAAGAVFLGRALAAGGLVRAAQ
jgi:predicted DNA-binding transcriptional regulator YafY